MNKTEKTCEECGNPGKLERCKICERLLCKSCFNSNGKICMACLYRAEEEW